MFHRGRTEADLPPLVKHIRGDRRSLGDLGSEFKRFAPEVVLDMIPINEVDARGLVAAFRGIARRTVAISSQDVYRAYDRVIRRDSGSPDRIPLSEDAPLREKLYPYEREEVEDYEKILVEGVVMGTPTCPARSCGYLRCTDRATTSTVCSSTSSAWTRGGPPS